MLDTPLLKKNRVNLEDYDFRKDIENRLLIAKFTQTDLSILEEIIYSSISIPVRKLAKTLDLEEETVVLTLKKLEPSGLFSWNEGLITIDKEMRKYFEIQILKFDPQFKPGMEFLQSLLRQVPIHVLPNWYAISRTSNNIFDSIVEKHLLTPAIFQRYLMELSLPDPLFSCIYQDVYKAPDFTLFADQIIDKYSLSREKFEECILYLEFYFLCCLGYQKVGEEWKEIVTPFYEWHEYLRFLRSTESLSITKCDDIQRFRPRDFSFVEDLSLVLKEARYQPLILLSQTEWHPHTETHLLSKLPGTTPAYLQYLLTKLRQLKLADIIDHRLYALETASDYLDMRPENQALFLYRHPLNRFHSLNIPLVCTDRHIKEAEKSIQRVLHSGWVYFDDFIQGVTAPLSELSLISLKRQGRTWKYALPSYSDEEITLIKTVIFSDLFEMGVTAIGTHQGKDCFTVTPFGQSLFGR